MSDEIVWEDPPSTAGRPRVWVHRLAPLLERPGQWGRVWEGQTKGSAYSASQAIGSYRYQLPPGRWEATSRTVDGHFYVYARYLGPEE